MKHGSNWMGRIKSHEFSRSSLFHATKNPKEVSFPGVYIRDYDHHHSFIL